MCLCFTADIPAVASAAGARAVAASTGPGPGARAGPRARPEMERPQVYTLLSSASIAQNCKCFLCLSNK